MVTLLTGKKGSGKTKKLIELAKEAVEKSNGNVVLIEKGQKLTYNLPYSVRLIDSDAYDVKGADALLGFISGICAGNYDVTDIFVDSTLKITGTDASVTEALVDGLKKLSSSAETNFVLSISAGEEEIPASVQDCVLK